MLQAVSVVEGENGADYGGSEEMLDNLTPLLNVPQLVEWRLSLCIALKLYPQRPFGVKVT